jgi:hypothetical protein
MTNKEIILKFGNGNGILNQEVRFTENELKKIIKQICKPCWELKYCPYGPVVENYPLPNIPRKDAIDHNEYLKEIVKNKKFSDGKLIDKERLKLLKDEIDSFNSKDYPEKENKIVEYMSCSEFGHLCPAFFVSEGFTETKDLRSKSRNIPRDILIRVIRRDNSMCQKCSKILLDRDIEIDHIIPWSRGGSTTESNLQVLCFDCNRSKSNKLDDIFHKNARYFII